MKRRWLSLISGSLLLVLLAGFIFVLTEQERISKRFAGHLFSYPLPENTSIIERDYFYGHSFGHLLGSGGYMPVIVSMQLSTRLSKEDIIKYYKDAALFPFPGSGNKGVELELYFEGEYSLHKTDAGYYYTNHKEQMTRVSEYKDEEGSIKPAQRENNEELRYILQLSSSFDYVLNID
ncbi:hypothetical protein ACFFSY_00795 [Paenibacillus aurantiacus]|uniref:Uncharacterized protein n=1 Tax=Paenibacillus aurantiacus TaxID=1936118 RepID=A0ABV5KGY1_9BACL